MKNNRRTFRVVAIVLVAVICLCAVGCDNGTPIIITTAPAATSATPPDTTSGNEPSATTVAHSETSSPETTAPDVTTDPASSEDPETSAVPAVLYEDPLTGLRIERDLSLVRPIALVYDNVSAAAPQSGISRADILIECMVEGGISRLIAITNDYGSGNELGGLEVYGPIRSTRHYIVSISQIVDSLMVGAGYSDQGYGAIKNNNLHYINPVHQREASNNSFRDPARISSAGYEHSLMFTGKGIEKAAAMLNYPVTVSSPVSFPFNFVAEDRDVVLTGGAAYHTILKYSSYQEVQFIYSTATGTYYRYQFGDKAHLDAENGEQLNFKNIFVLFAKQERIEGDTEGRLNVGVTGTGSGYYISGGRYTPITWSRASDTSPIVFTTSDGFPLTVNRGTTFISVVSDTLKGTSSIVLNYSLN